jgi:hypothetical protein
MERWTVQSSFIASVELPGEDERRELSLTVKHYAEIG